MSCCVPGCTSLAQEWLSEFPREGELQVRWTAAIQAGTGQVLPDECKTLVCNIHFGVNGKKAMYREPSLFFRNNILLEVSWCRVCFRFEAIDKMLDREDCLKRGNPLEWMSKMYSGLLQLDMENAEEDFFCEKCIARVSKTDNFEQEICNAAKKHAKLLGKMKLENIAVKIIASNRIKHTDTECCLASSEKNKDSVEMSEDEISAMEPSPKKEGILNGSVVTFPRNEIVKQESVLSQTDVLLESYLNLHNEGLIAVEEDITVKEEPADPYMSDHLEDSVESLEHIIVKEETQLTESELRPTEVASEAQKKQLSKCYICNTLLESEDSLAKHLKTDHNSLQSLRCEECKVSFKTLDFYNDHLEGHEHNTSFKFDRITASKKHEAVPISQPENDERECGICGQVFTERDDLKAHVTAQHRGISHGTGAICDKPCKSNGSLKTRNKNKNQHKCKTCSASFCSNNALVQHVKKSHPDPRVPSGNLNELVCYTQPGLRKPSFLENKRRLASRSGGGESRTKPMCRLCKVVFQHSKEIVSHFKEVHTTTNLRYYPCRDCDEVYFSSINLFNHSSQHDGRFTCKQCGKNMSSKASLENHRHTIHGEPLSDDKYVNCPVCDQKFVRFNFNRHLRLHEEKQFGCETCGEKFRTSIGLRDHRSFHTGEKPYVCSRCGMRYRVRVSLYSHIRVCKAVQHKHSCATCGKSFANGEELEIHEKANASSVQCKPNDASYSKKKELTKHVASVHNDASKLASDSVPKKRRMLLFKETIPGSRKKTQLDDGQPVASMSGGDSGKEPKCNVCHVVFQHKNDILPHFNELHPDINLRYYPCTVCEEFFLNSGSRLHHLKTHGATEFACDQCEKRLSSKEALTNHRISFHQEPLAEERCVKCPICDRKCRRDFFARHMRSHKEGEFKCDQCHRRFAERCQLTYHQRLHNGEKPLMCSGCGKRYALYSSLNSHKRYCLPLAANKASGSSV